MKYIIFSIFTLFSIYSIEFNKTFFIGLAIDGYDTVSYFKESKAVIGKKEFEYSWSGAKWRFSSKENLELFQKDPQKYAPQYGGYCAYAMSYNEKYKISPESWSIENGKLYLNYDKETKTDWENDKKNLIEKADENWKKNFLSKK